MRIRVSDGPGRHKYIERKLQGLPCVYRGAKVGDEDCNACGAKNGKLDRFACTLHSECSVSALSKRAGVACCNLCTDRIEPKTPQDWLRIIDEDTPKPKAWASIPAVQEAYRLDLRRQIESCPPYPHTYAGRGCVIVGGGSYLPSAYVTASVLRHVGWPYPIQLWHLPTETVEDKARVAFAALDVEVVQGGSQAPYRTMGGWQLKTYAVLNCPWREVLYLDAESYPTRDPSYLFDWSRYRETGSIFFPDLPHWKLKDEAWRLFGLEPIQEPDWEVGQWVVDKESVWEELQVSHWFNQHSDYWYQHLPIGLYGDKPMHMIWRVMGREFHHPQGAAFAGWDLHTILQYDQHGAVIFQHRVRDKWRLGGETITTTPQTWKMNRHNPRLAHEDFCFASLGRFREALT